MSGPIISPDGTKIWNGVSWVPLNQNQIYQQGLNNNLQNMPRVVTIQNKSSNAPVYIIVGIICLVVVLAGLEYTLRASERNDTVFVSEFIVEKEFLGSESEEITICNKSRYIDPGSYIACEVSLDNDYYIEISFSLESNNQNVNLMTMRVEEYQKFVNGEDAEYIETLSELYTTKSELEGSLSSGDYVFIVHNF